jgi:endothelin-converting enzyme
VAYRFIPSLDIIESFKASLPHIAWMDEKSAKAAAEKVFFYWYYCIDACSFLRSQADAIRVKVGFPLSPNTQDPASILKYYRSVQVHQDDFFGNMISAT